MPYLHPTGVIMEPYRVKAYTRRKIQQTSEQDVRNPNVPVSQQWLSKDRCPTRMQTLSTDSLESILVFSCISHTTCSVSRSVLLRQCVWDEKGISQINFIVCYLAHVIASSKNKKQKFAIRSWKNADTYFRTETSVPWLGTCGDKTA